MKAIIYLTMPDSHRMPPIGAFKRSTEYDCHIWQGRDFDLSDSEQVDEFNRVVSQALYAPNMNFRPSIKLIEDAEVPHLSHLETPIEPETAKRRGRPPKLIPAAVA